MSANEVIAEIKRLPRSEQTVVLSFLVGELAADRIATEATPGSGKWIGREMGFDEAAQVVFAENRELLRRLAQ